MKDLTPNCEVTTKRFNEQVRRNLARFPGDFIFQLAEDEWEFLRSQFATLKRPGVASTASICPSFHRTWGNRGGDDPEQPRATEVSVYVVRAFVALRELLTGNKELAAKLNELAHKVDSHDQAIAGLINAMRELMRSPEPKQNQPIGFVTEKRK